MKLKGLIFDLDGTLMNTLPVCYAGFRTAFRKFLGKDFSDEEIASLFGPSEEGIMKKLFPDQWEDCLEAYLEAYDKAHPPYSKPFPGVTDALRLLSRRGIRLAIVSGKGPHSMAISLKHSELESYFEMVETGSEKGADKPNRIQRILRAWEMPPHEAAYIGDTAYDIMAAKEAGVSSLGAVWAETAETEGILQMKPERIFYDVDSFIQWIETQ